MLSWRWNRISPTPIITVPWPASGSAIILARSPISRRRCSASRAIFAALETLSRIAEARNDYKGALAAWQKALELSPRTPDGADRLKALQKKVLGEES